MQAIAYTLPISDPLALQDVHLPNPSASGHDLLVEVAAVAVNLLEQNTAESLSARKLHTKSMQLN